MALADAVKEIVDRSGLQCATAACVIAGGLLVGGPGVVLALADPGGAGQHDADGSHPSGSGVGPAGVRHDYNVALESGTSARGGNPRQHRWGQWLGDWQGEGAGGAGEGTGGTGLHEPCDHSGGNEGGGGNSGGLGAPPPGSGGTSGPPGHGGRRPPPVIVPGVPQQPQPPPVVPDIVGATMGPAEGRPPEAGPPVLTLPLVVSPPAVGGVGPGPRVELPRGAGTPPEVKSEPLSSPREPVPGETGNTDGGPSESFRSGYSDYLRTAGVTEMAALALPGVGGILLLTAGGGFIGYRQAKAGHAVRTEGIARFLH
jgi:hypothetical protein